MYYMIKDSQYNKIRYFNEGVVQSADLDENGEGTVILKSGHHFECIGTIEENLQEAAQEFYTDMHYYKSVIRGLTDSIKKQSLEGKIKATELKALMSLRKDTIDEFETLGGKIIKDVENE